MTQGVLNDRNNIFLHVYYAPFFLGSSNNIFASAKDFSYYFHLEYFKLVHLVVEFHQENCAKANL